MHQRHPRLGRCFAASLVLAQAETPDAPQDAAQRAHDVLDNIPPARLRCTARTRLSQLTALLSPHDSTATSDLSERLRTLPPPINAHGQAPTG